MTLLYYDPLFLEHDTGKHPERAQRLAQVVRHLERISLVTPDQWQPCPPISTERLTQVHSREYVRGVEQFARGGGGRIEEDTVCSQHSYEAATMAAGAVTDAVERVILGPEKRAFCLVRPPGHHALRSSSMGFCLFNSVAIAAKVAVTELELARVLIVDWDVHHGNGTQATFWTDEQVGFFSIHRWPFYPGTGTTDETGSGPGLGTTLNLPVEMGTSRAEYLDTFRRGLEEMARKMKPELILISAGFDSHRDDPVGSLGLETEDFIPLTQAVLDVANTYCAGRVVSVLEGGYNPGILAGCVEVHLRELMLGS